MFEKLLNRYRSHGHATLCSDFIVARNGLGSTHEQQATADGFGPEGGYSTSASAGMRPRHDDAENRNVFGGIPRSVQASMRPRHDAAENRYSSGPRITYHGCFNEAAA